MNIKESSNGESRVSSTSRVSGTRLSHGSRHDPHRPLGPARPTRMQRLVPPQPGFVGVSLALASWMLLALRFAVGILGDRVVGRDSSQRRAERMRRLLEGKGSIARKIGMQFATRIDLHSLEMSAELGKLSDSMEPFPVEEAIRLVEAAVGCPIEEAFQAFDPEPIVSNTVACIYQAVLDSGEKVAVKVRRPSITRRFVADLAALGLLIQLLEVSTIVRPGRFRFLRSELTSMVLEELDFVHVTRLQRMYRRNVRRAGIRYATAARIFKQYTTADVIISEFVAGVWADEVLSAQDRGDADSVAYFAERDIHPERLGKRLLHVAWWSLLENAFFTTCPLTSNIVVQPGDKIVFVNIGECDILPHKKRRMVRHLLRSLSRNDASDAAQALVHLLSPLPFIDVGEFRRRLENRLWPVLLAMRNPQNRWWERTTTGVWKVLVETSREYGVSFRLDIVRLMRACIMNDILAGRLWHQLNLLGEFNHYLRDAGRRKAREGRAMMRTLGGGGDLAVFQLDQNIEAWRRMNLWAQSVIENVPLEYVSLTKKSSYSISVAFRAVAMVVVGTLAPAGILMARNWEHAMTLGQALRVVFVQPIYVGFVLTVIAYATRVIVFRLRDREVSTAK
jgi:ubiquinone biosynthesis protein